MKIILVNKFHYIKGGSETYYFSLAEALRERGHEVHFFSMQDERNRPCEDADLFVSHREYNGKLSIREQASSAVNLIWSREARDKFQKLCERVHPDIIHLNLVHRQITLSILDAPYVKQRRVPVVYTAHEYVALCPCYTMLDGRGEVCEDCLHGSYAGCIKKRCVKGSLAKSVLAVAEAEFIRNRRYYERIDSIIAPSRFLAEKLNEGGFSSEKVVALQNFLPDSVVQEIDSVEPLREKDPYLLYFGRLSKEKGVDVLLKAYARYAETVDAPMRLKIVGTGPLESALKALAERLDVSGHVDFVGFKSGLELRSIVKGATFSVIPSVWYENMPYSGLESLASGTPVIGSNIGGIPEFIEDNVTGYLAVPGDVDSLVSALLRAGDLDKQELVLMDEACHLYVGSNCGERDYCNSIIDLYMQCLKNRLNASNEGCNAAACNDR